MDLWGLYVGSYRTYEEWKQEKPKTDITSKLSSYRTYEEWKQSCSLNPLSNTKVLTVPMRNGNAVADGVLSSEEMGSYRTYEEWKPQQLVWIHLLFDCSYRTYEEWKHHDTSKRNNSVSLFLPYL